MSFVFWQFIFHQCWIVDERQRRGQCRPLLVRRGNYNHETRRLKRAKYTDAIIRQQIFDMLSKNTDKSLPGRD